MTDPLTLSVAAVAVVVAAIAAWLHHPRPPTLDGERWFKVWLATGLRGRVERARGDADAWSAEVVRFVPYHPSGRAPERKIAGPDRWRPAGPWLDGEQALVEALAVLPDTDARWAHLYAHDTRGTDARLVDPHTLGRDYEPSTWVGPAGTWDEVAEGRVAARAVERLGARWLLVDGRPGAAPPLLDAVAALLPDAARVAWTHTDLAAGVDAVHGAARALVEDRPDRRLVIVAAEAGVQLALRAMVHDEGLRDRIVAVVSVGGVLRGLPDEDGPFGRAVTEDWMARWFGHDTLDTEVLLPTPYLALQWWDRGTPAGAGVPLDVARWPAPRAPERVPELVRPVDLGLLPTDAALPLDLVARALVGVTACMALALRRHT